MSENVITTDDFTEKKIPKSFRDLNKAELVAAAEYFGTESEGNAEALKADLASSGVTFESYLAVFHPTETVVPEEELLLNEPEPVTEVLTAEPEPSLEVSQKYLIKFVGENPYFEFGPYKFSRNKPYGILPAADAQRALVEEPTKFRQAFPAELEEFYS